MRLRTVSRRVRVRETGWERLEERASGGWSWEVVRRWAPRLRLRDMDWESSWREGRWPSWLVEGR